MSGDPTIDPPPPRRQWAAGPRVTKKLLADLRWCAETDGNGGLVIYQREAKAILTELEKKYG